jgi:hypothetical protein
MEVPEAVRGESEGLASIQTVATCRFVSKSGYGACPNLSIDGHKAFAGVFASGSHEIFRSMRFGLAAKGWGEGARDPTGLFVARAKDDKKKMN